MKRSALLSILLAIAWLACTPGHTQEATRQPTGLERYIERYKEPIQLYKRGLGTFTRPISSRNAEAQAFFDQGFQMMYSFAKPEAVRSFREAWKRDPDCAICYWGEAWAWGSYLNAPMVDLEAAGAYAAAQKALSMRGKADRKERALIDAMALRYVKNFDASKRMDQEKIYAEAIGKVAAAFPDDLDIATLHADALFLLQPRRGARDMHDPEVHRLHQVLEGILSRNVMHPGACHLYVHATESTVEPGRAEACAEFLGRSIPGASHINHMPSHTWNEIGRWGDSVRANLEAWHSDQKASVGEGFAIYPEHNLHMLLYAASYDGQGAIAMRAGKDYSKLAGDTSYEVLTLLRFGRFDEILEVKDRPGQVVQGAFWDFAQGYARLKLGEPDFAALYLKRIKETAETATAGFRFYTARELLPIVAGILEGEMQRMAGDLTAAIASFERASSLQEGLTYDEPEPVPFSAFHWLGAALLEAGRNDEAEQVYRRELKDHPKNGWSLFGIRQAKLAKGEAVDAITQEFDASWARSDTWIRGSKF